VEKWREKAKNICEGREVKESLPPSSGPHTPGKPGGQFIKI
jgi:hypothetical protein